MKVLVTTIILLVAFASRADQLAYISKEDAEKAVKVISKLRKVYLFCGCCSLEEPKKVKPVKVYYEYTNYESYYEVFIEYKDDNGKVVREPVDLAYIWRKKRKKYQTIGQVLNLEHDPCVYLENWDSDLP